MKNVGGVRDVEEVSKANGHAQLRALSAGDGEIIGAGGRVDGYITRFAELKIDIVEAHAESADRLQFRRVLEHFGINLRAIANDNGAGIAQRFEQRGTIINQRRVVQKIECLQHLPRDRFVHEFADHDVRHCRFPPG